VGGVWRAGETAVGLLDGGEGVVVVPEVGEEDAEDGEEQADAEVLAVEELLEGGVWILRRAVVGYEDQEAGMVEQACGCDEEVGFCCLFFCVRNLPVPSYLGEGMLGKGRSSLIWPCASRSQCASTQTSWQQTTPSESSSATVRPSPQPDPKAP